LIARDRPGDKQIYAIEPCNLIRDFVELERTEERVIEVRHDADYDLFPPGRASGEQLGESLAHSVIKRPM